jgi:transcriptional regulator with XRE-family HTH domain
MPKEKPKVNIGEVIRSYRGQRGLSQGDIERRTGLLRCYLSRVENGHTVPSLETLAKIAEAMEISLADFFPGTETAHDRDTQKMLGELSEDEIRFLSEIKRRTPHRVLNVNFFPWFEIEWLTCAFLRAPNVRFSAAAGPDQASSGLGRGLDLTGRKMLSSTSPSVAANCDQRRLLRDV